MKRINYFFVIIICLLFATSAYSASAKIGVIDFQRVLRESNAGKAAKADIEKKGKSMENSLKKRGKEIEKLKKKFEAEALVMSGKTREDRQREFRIKLNDFKELQKKYAMDFKAYEAKTIKKIQKDVFKIVQQMGKKGGYSLIIEKGATLYYPDSADVTDMLIKKYNAAYKKK